MRFMLGSDFLILSQSAVSGVIAMIRERPVFKRQNCLYSAKQWGGRLISLND